MENTIEMPFGSTFDDIKKISGYKYAVVICDHYIHNPHGYWCEIDKIVSIRHWVADPDDRGIFRMFLTNDDIPALRDDFEQKNKEKAKLEGIVNLARAEYDKIWKYVPPFSIKKTSGQIKAEEENAAAKRVLDEKTADALERIEILRKEIMKNKYRHISHCLYL